MHSDIAWLEILFDAASVQICVIFIQMQSDVLEERC